MGRITTETDWVAQMHGLTVHPEHDGAADQISESQRRITVLRRAARALVVADSQQVSEALAAVAQGVLARALAEELAHGLPGGEGDPPADRSHSGHELVMAYLRALRQASTAVYFCRRIQHASGSCWFSIHGPAQDVCGRVLSITHALGDGTRPATRAVAPRRRP